MIFFFAALLLFVASLVYVCLPTHFLSASLSRYFILVHIRKYLPQELYFIIGIIQTINKQMSESTNSTVENICEYYENNRTVYKC